MEAANLGAWMAAFADDALDDALAMLAPVPNYATDAHDYVERALAVRARWPRGGESLGVPTWVYVDEPTSAFASHIAKYFTNSIREDGLLAIARSGVVYAPGGAGTEQEIFTDTAQNSLTLYKVRSPMIFFGRQFFDHEHPELATAARRQAEAFGWPELVAVCDEPDQVVAFIGEHDPDAAGRAGVERRRTHQDS
jgi:predicted Rossmann-fold nucleotide-binding protein